MSNLFKPITPEITELKTGTPIIKYGDKYVVAGIGGDFIPNGVTDVPGGPGVDNSDATEVQPSDVSEGLVFYNAEGRQVGTMPDVEVVYSSGGPSFPVLLPGRLREAYQVEIPAGVYATHDASDVLSLDVSEGLVFYNAEGRQVGSLPDASVHLKDGSEGTVAEISAGRVRSDITIDLPDGVYNTRDADAVASDLPLGVIAYTSTGRIVGTSTGGSTAGDSVVLGQVNADGDFQALAFNGTNASNSGDPEAVETYYTYNGVLPVPECGESDSGGGSVDFYQCAEVFGPEKVSGFVVSGAGTAAVNGNYSPTELRTEEDTPVYKHETAEYYYFEMRGEKGICTSPTQYPSDGLYYNMYDEGWTTANGGAEPAPTVTAGNIVINADTPKTWNGYKAVWSDKDGYAFEETVTEGLTYGSALNPTPGSIYDGLATVEIGKLFESIKPITTNDTSCLIYIDGTTLANQALAQNKHEVTFGSGVTAQDGYLNITNDESGQILTTAKTDGYGGNLKAWTWDYFFVSDASYLDCSGHSSYGWTVEGTPGNSLFFRGQNADGKKLGVTFTQNELICLSMQYDDGVLHVWNKGIYVGTCTPTFPNCDGTPFGIGCIADVDYDRMADKIKFFRFSNKLRYTPGVDFELPEGFVE